MGRSLRETQAAVSAREFTLWAAFYQTEPWGEERADLRAGIIAHTVYAMNRGKGSAAMSPAEFMPQFDRPAPNLAAVPAQLDAVFQGMLPRLGAG